jgi:hypothetical protein
MESNHAGLQAFVDSRWSTAHAKPKHAITTPINGNAPVPAIDPAQLRAEFFIKAHPHTAESILDVALLNRK